MGYLVLQSKDNKRFDIIDGQQRLTTLSLLILAGLSHLNALIQGQFDAEKNQIRLQSLRSSYIGYLDPISLVSHSKLSLNRHNDAFYQNYLAPLHPLPQRGLNASEHLLRKAFLWLLERLKQRVGNDEESGKKIAILLDQIVDQLFFTVITVNDELNAFKVFETLNARGVRLSSTDLLKNYLFSLLSHQQDQEAHEIELRAFEARWERIVSLLGANDFSDFLRVYWNSQYKIVRKNELFQVLRKHLRDRKDAFSFLVDTEQAAEIYTALRDPLGSNSFWKEDEREALEQLLMFNVRQPLAMLLAAYRLLAETSRDGFTKLVKAIVILSFRYNVICNLPTPDQEQLYNHIARQITEGHLTTAEEIIERLRELYPQDSYFKESFTEKELRTTHTRNRKILRYLLFEIEKRVSQRELDWESDKYNIEHILPENPSEAWDSIEEAKQERMIYRIGNMTLLETAKNRDIGNKGYEVKREIYAQSDIHITRAIAEHNETWDEKKLRARQAQLAKKAVEIWRIPYKA